MKNTFRIFILVTIIFPLLLPACNTTGNDAADASPPNFVLIYTDEMQFSDLGCYGGSIPTPHIDQLAAEGIMFNAAYTVASMCTPSRYAVLTGQFPGRCSASSFLEENPVDEPYSIAWNTWITCEKMTLPRILSQHGYTTGMAGKWHIGEVPGDITMPVLEEGNDPDDPEIEAKLNLQQEIYQQLIRTQAGFDEANSVLWGNFDGQKLQALNFHNFPWMTKGALTFLDHQKETRSPFFLYFAPTAVHGPNHYSDLSRDVTYTPGGRDRSLDRYQLDTEELKKRISDEHVKNKHRYAGMAQTDFAVGLLLEKIREIGQENNTVIIFISDHNIEPGKATSYEKGIRVPMIIYWPGKTSREVSDQLVQNIDIYPMILDEVGIDIPQDHELDGKNMLPLVNDPGKAIRTYIFAENGYTRSVCNGTYKYIALRYPQSIISRMESGELSHVPSYVGAWPQAHSAIAMNSFPAYFDQDQLYNIKTDPFEINNLYDEMADSEILRNLRTALEDHLAGFKHPFDLSTIPFLETEAYQKLIDNNLVYDIYDIPWLSRDHGRVEWPGEL